MSNLFDDDDEQEFKPQETPAAQQEETAAAAQAEAPSDNPYAAEMAAPQQEHQETPQQQEEEPQVHQAEPTPAAQQDGAFDGGEEEEYKPQEVEEVQANPYAAQEMPMGFGAERANLMAQEAVQMPDYAAAGHSVQGQQDEDHAQAPGETAGGDLNVRANNAKTQLIQEILAFNSETAQIEGAAEDHKDELEQASQAFTVVDPVKVGKVTKYTVTGRDSNGEWTCQRRFNEFEKLQRVLLDRWPGCYIPAIPEKLQMGGVDMANMKMQNNEDPEFIEMRRVLLEKFIRQISHFDYLLESKEFQIFCRGAGEVTSQLESLEPQRPIEILEKYRVNFAIDEDQANSEMLMYKEKISSFAAYLNKAYVQLEKQVESFRKFSANYDQSHAHYKKIYTNLIAFEDMSIDAYSDGDRTNRVLSHPIAQELPEKISESVEKWRNPFREAFLTLRGEVLDLKAMMNAMQGRSNQEVLQTKTEQRQREKKSELEKMTLGKTTLKSFFKSKNTIQKDIDAYSATIQQLDVDIEQYKKLVNFITIYHGQIAIDKFKRLKSSAYYKMLNSFSVREVSNAHLHATLAHSILEMQDQF